MFIRTAAAVLVLLFLACTGSPCQGRSNLRTRGVDAQRLCPLKPESTDAERPWGWNKG